MRKATFLRCFVLALLALTILSGCQADDRQLQQECEDFSQILEHETLDGLCLKIYYLDPSVLTRAPLTVDDLIDSRSVHMIVVDSEQLKEHIELLNQMTVDNLVPVKHTSHYATRLNARLCYIFETDNNGKVLEVAVGGLNNSVFVNGIEVEYNDIFRDIIEPFVTEEEMVRLEYIFRGELLCP